MNTTIKILKADHHSAPGKLADAEIHFTGGELDGLKLVGFAVWQKRDGHGQNVSFPSRQFTAHGERRSFSLLRWIATRSAQDRLVEVVLQAYRDNQLEPVGDGSLVESDGPRRRQSSTAPAPEGEHHANV